MITDIEIPDTFEALFYPFPSDVEPDNIEKHKSYTYKIWHGGRSGCKSHSIARALLIKGSEKKLRIYCTREFWSTMADSVKALLDDRIEEYDLGWFYKSVKNTIVGANGTTFIFGGLKLNNKGIKGKEKIDIVWIEEAETISQESLDILIPTIVRNPDAEIWITFNPYTSSDPVLKLIDTGREDIFHKKVTFKDNPFFTDKERIEMEYCKEHDYDKYLWIWEGEPLAISNAAVFKGKFKIDKFEAPEDTVFYHGLDLGFSVDPLAFLRCYIDQEKRLLYIDKGKSAIEVEIDDTPAFLEGTIPDCKQWMITADSARPEIISYLDKRGFKIRAAKKGPASIVEGVEFIKNYTTIIHESLKGVIHEFNIYSHKVDKLTGDILPLIEDKNNHFIDALRYAVEALRTPIYKSIVLPPRGT